MAGSWPLGPVSRSLVLGGQRTGCVCLEGSSSSLLMLFRAGGLWRPKGCVSRSGSESVRLGLREVRGKQRGEAEILHGVLVQAWLQDSRAKCRERPSHSSGWLLRELP